MVGVDAQGLLACVLNRLLVRIEFATGDQLGDQTMDAERTRLAVDVDVDARVFADIPIADVNLSDPQPAAGRLVDNAVGHEARPQCRVLRSGHQNSLQPNIKSAYTVLANAPSTTMPSARRTAEMASDSQTGTLISERM